MAVQVVGEEAACCRLSGTLLPIDFQDFGEASGGFARVAPKQAVLAGPARQRPAGFPEHVQAHVHRVIIVAVVPPEGQEFRAIGAPEGRAGRRGHGMICTMSLTPLVILSMGVFMLRPLF